MAEATLGDWRGIDALAALVGHYDWLEWRLFTVMGAWAAGPEGDAAARVWCAAAARRHGDLAARWAERLPVRAGIDPGAFVEPPSAELAEAFERLADRPGAEAGPAVVASAVLPRLAAMYGAHLAVASPVREASVAEVLADARRIALGEAGRWGSVVRNDGVDPGLGSPGDDLVTVFERLFDNWCVFPAVRTS